MRKVTRKRRVGLIVVGAAVGALIIRFWIGMSVGSSIPDNPLGFGVLDAFFLAVVLVGLAVFVALWALGYRYRAVHKAARRQFPQGETVITSVVPATAYAVAQASLNSDHLASNSVAAVLLSQDECSWWTGSGELRCVARIRSDDAIVYSVGKLEHFGPTDALVVSVRVDGRDVSVPIAALTGIDDRFLPRLMTSAEIGRAIQSFAFGQR
jgi:hypothetical protein